MTRKTPTRVFLNKDTHSRYLIQAGTHGLTPSLLGELLIIDGLKRLERGDTSSVAVTDGLPADQAGD